MQGKQIGQSDFEDAAKSLGCDVPTIKAVALVESNGDGFLSNGEPKILFEAHHFSKMTAGQFDKRYPNISSHYWNRGLYKGGEEEHKRLKLAVSLDRDAALKSTSWGKFQIMGFNWKACGYASLQDFVNDMYESEAGQLRAFVGFVKAMRLVDAMQDHNWRAFARGYNGPGYEQNAYDKKLEKAYNKFKEAT